MLSKTDIDRIKRKISQNLKKYASISPAKTVGILPIKALQGKLYEAHVLSTVIENLASKEGFIITLAKGGSFKLKQKGSPINRAYPYFEVRSGTNLIGENFTDTEFVAQSHGLRKGTKLEPGDYHELDIVMLCPGSFGRPNHTQVLLAIECKATSIEKSTFREVLGFRRELSFLNGPVKTIFSSWPIDRVNANPPSVHMCFSTDPAILKYKLNALTYGVLMVHEKM